MRKELLSGTAHISTAVRLLPVINQCGKIKMKRIADALEEYRKLN